MLDKMGLLHHNQFTENGHKALVCMANRENFSIQMELDFICQKFIKSIRGCLFLCIIFIIYIESVSFVDVVKLYNAENMYSHPGSIYSGILWHRKYVCECVCAYTLL